MYIYNPFAQFIYEQRQYSDLSSIDFRGQNRCTTDNDCILSNLSVKQKFCTSLILSVQLSLLVLMEGVHTQTLSDLMELQVSKGFMCNPFTCTVKLV